MRWLTRRKPKHRLELYERRDGQWAWRLRAPNGRIVATDGNQGFASYRDAYRAADAAARGFSSTTLALGDPE